MTFLHKLFGGQVSLIKTEKVEMSVTPPVFVFAASWRTGSTLLQRILNASGELLIWGEPGCLKDAEALFSRCQRYLSKMPHANKGQVLEQSGQWIPTISPEVNRSVVAMRSFFSDLYGQEAAELGFGRWGFKEVRPGAAKHIRMLRVLFPGAKFVFLMRDPIDTFRSLQGKKFYQSFENPMKPMVVWRDNVQDCVVEGGLSGDDLLVVKHEDIVSPEVSHSVLEKICLHTNLRMTEKMTAELSIVVDSSTKKGLNEELVEKVKSVVAETASRVGYVL